LRIFVILKLRQLDWSAGAVDQGPAETISSTGISKNRLEYYRMQNNLKTPYTSLGPPSWWRRGFLPTSALGLSALGMGIAAFLVWHVFIKL